MAITGGGAGIGEACAKLAAAQGAAVAVIDRDMDQAQRVASEILDSGGRARGIAADVAQSDQINTAIDECVREYGELAFVVSSAGIQRYGSPENISDDDWDEVLRVNLTGAFYLCRAAIPHLRARGGGSIVLVGSAQSVAARPSSAHYVASKHGLLGLARALSLDGAVDRIRVNCVLPGTVDTPMLHWAAGLTPDPAAAIEATARSHPLGRVAQPDEIARVVAFLLSSDSSFMTGAAVPVDGGLLTAAGGWDAQAGQPGAAGA